MDSEFLLELADSSRIVSDEIVRRDYAIYQPVQQTFSNGATFDIVMPSLSNIYSNVHDSYIQCQTLLTDGGSALGSTDPSLLLNAADHFQSIELLANNTRISYIDNVGVAKVLCDALFREKKNVLAMEKIERNYALYCPENTTSYRDSGAVKYDFTLDTSATPDPDSWALYKRQTTSHASGIVNFRLYLKDCGLGFSSCDKYLTEVPLTLRFRLTASADATRFCLEGQSVKCDGFTLQSIQWVIPQAQLSPQLSSQARAYIESQPVSYRWLENYVEASVRDANTTSHTVSLKQDVSGEMPKYLIVALNHSAATIAGGVDKFKVNNYAHAHGTIKVNTMSLTVNNLQVPGLQYDLFGSSDVFRQYEDYRKFTGISGTSEPALSYSEYKDIHQLFVFDLSEHRINTVPNSDVSVILRYTLSAASVNHILHTMFISEKQLNIDLTTKQMIPVIAL